MNEKFHQLPEEKQLAIFNAAMDVFARNDYKKASTDDIAAKAGISKGMLFYYFHNKRTLYLETYDYAMRTGRAAINDPHLFELTDFFELLDYATEKKLRVMTKMPYLYDFFLRTLYNENKEIAEPLREKISQDVADIYNVYFRNINKEKFIDGIDPTQVLNMLTWMATGYLHLQHFAGNTYHLDTMAQTFSQCAQLVKKACYKEEYL